MSVVLGYMLVLIAFVLAIPTAAGVVVGAFEAVHRRPGVCLGCGYSLRGIEDSVKCPECGRPPRTAPPPGRVPVWVYLLLGFAVIGPELSAGTVPAFCAGALPWAIGCGVLGRGLAVINLRTDQSEINLILWAACTPVIVTRVATMPPLTNLNPLTGATAAMLFSGIAFVCGSAVAVSRSRRLL